MEAAFMKENLTAKGISHIVNLAPSASTQGLICLNQLTEIYIIIVRYDNEGLNYLEIDLLDLPEENLLEKLPKILNFASEMIESDHLKDVYKLLSGEEMQTVPKVIIQSMI